MTPLRPPRLWPLSLTGLLVIGCGSPETSTESASQPVGPGPDFVIRGFSSPPSASGPFTTRITVCNEGDSFAPGAPVELYASLDTTLTMGADFLVGSQWVSNLTAGECRAVDVSGPPPPQQGAQYLLATVDPYGSVAEGSETNNRWVGPLTGFGFGPELRVESITGPPSAQSGFTAQVTVCNRGTNPSSSTQVDLYATLDQTLVIGPPPSGDFFIGSAPVSGLAPGQCSVAAVSAFSPPIANGAAYLAALADPYGNVSELIEGNNSAVGSLMGFGSGPDLVVSSVSGPASANGAFTAQVRVCNQGTASSGGFDVELYTTVDQVLAGGPPPTGDPMIGSAWSDPINAGQCRTVSINAWAPPIAGGAAYLAAFADRQSSVPELIESNNTRIGALTGFGFGPDLVVTQISGPASANSGFTALVTVCNRGTGDASSANVMLVASTDTTVTAGPPFADPFLGSNQVNLLPAGSCSTVSINAAPPPMVGAAYLGAMVDESRVVSELIESNNTFLGALTGFGAGPDLRVTQVKTPPSANAAFVAQVTVCNRGTTDASGSSMDLYGSLDTVVDPTPTDTLIGSVWVNNLSAGACRTLDVNAWPPPLGSATAGYVLARADIGQSVVELIEGNNDGASALMGFGYGADLVIASITAPPSANGPFVASVSVCNQGTAPSTSTNLDLVSSDDAVVQLPLGPGGDFMAGNAAVPALPAGVCTTIDVNAFPPPPSGALYLLGVVDAANAAAELIDGNNTAEGPRMGFGFGPDLVVKSVVVPPSANGPFDATVTVCNQGTADAVSADVELRGTVDTSIDASPAVDPPMGSLHFSQIPAGQCRSVTAAAFAPPLFGPAYVAAIVDPFGVVGELVEGNNTALSAVMGFGAGADLRVTALTAPASVNGTFSAQVTVCNLGTNAAPPSSVELFASVDTTLVSGPGPDSDFWLGSASVDPLPAGECDLVPMTVGTAPLGGAVYLIARADPYQGVTELIENNNDLASGVVGMGNAADAVVAAIAAPSSANGAFTAQVTVCNRGTASMPPSQVDLFGSADQALQLASPPWGDVALGTFSVGALAAGQCAVVPAALVSPPIVGAGYVIAVADRNAVVPELIESNNTRVSAQMGFGVGVDLAIGTVTAPASASGAFTAQVTACNRGTLAAPPSMVELYASTDPTLEVGPGADFPAGSANFPSLAAGQCQVVAVSGWSPPAQGALYLLAVVDRLASVSELIETNNVGVGPLMGFGTGPDLVIASLDANPYVFPGGLLGFTYRVCNRGTAASPSSELGLRFAPVSDAPLPGNTPSFIATVGGLAAGACATGSGSMPVATGVGPAYLIGLVDRWSVISELIESNNRAADPFEVAVVFCGNGSLDAGEACDDGNFTSGDGCSATCAVEYHPVWQENANGTLVSNIAWNYAMGYHFTPQRAGYITAIGGFFNGTKTVRLFDRTTGAVLAQANVTAANGWGYATIPPIAVAAGRRLTVAVYLAGSGGSYRYGIQTFPRTYGDVTIDGTTYAATSAANPAPRPTNTVLTTMYGQADVRFSRYP